MRFLDIFLKINFFLMEVKTWDLGQNSKDSKGFSRYFSKMLFFFQNSFKSTRKLISVGVVGLCKSGWSIFKNICVRNLVWKSWFWWQFVQISFLVGCDGFIKIVKKYVVILDDFLAQNESNEQNMHMQNDLLRCVGGLRIEWRIGREVFFSGF